VRKRDPAQIRFELAASLLALHDTLIEEQLLYLCDNQSLLKTVNRWIRKGGKATLVGAPEADNLAASIEKLRKRIAAGTATFFVKVKAHRGEPANKGSDILANKAISDPKVGKEWCQRTNRAVFTKLRRRYEKWCKVDDIEDCTHKQQYEASYQSIVKVLQQNTWMDDRKFLKSCV